MGEEKILGGSPRRSFIKGAALAAATGLFVGCTPQAEEKTETADTGSQPVPETTIHRGFCRGQCSNGCIFDVYVRDGQIVRMTAADTPDPGYKGICAKGLTHPARVYNADRLQYPMKRVEGTKRGEGKYERISWEEAMKTIGEKWKAITDEYGPKAFCIFAGGGNAGVLGGTTGLGNSTSRLLNVTGASTISLCHDQAKALTTGFMVGQDHFFGGNELSDLFNAKTIVCWGANPCNSDTQAMHWILEAKDKGIKYIVIDPVYAANASKADMYVPVNASTDGALAMGILNIVLQEDKQDTEFVRNHTNSPCLVKPDGTFFRKSDLSGEYIPTDWTTVEPKVYSRYAAVGGDEDPILVWDEESNQAVPIEEAAKPSLTYSGEINGIAARTVFVVIKERVAEYDLAKTEQITGVPQETIKELARVYTEEGPVSNFTLYGMDHYRNGHYNYVDTFTLGLMTGNSGKRGAQIARGYCFPLTIANAAGVLQPTDAQGNPCQGAGNTFTPNAFNEILDTGTFNGQETPLKGIYLTNTGFISNGTNRQRLVEAMQKFDFVIGNDIAMTETMSYADIILPAASWFEQTELQAAWHTHPYVCYQSKIIEPLFESKGAFEVNRMIAEELGYGEFFQLTEDEYLEIWLDTDEARSKGLTLDALRNGDPIRGLPGDEFIAGRDGVFATGDGRAQLYKEVPTINARQFVTPDIDMNKEFTVYWEPAAEADVNSPVREKFRFHVMNEHMRTRTHTQWNGVGQLQEYYQEPYARLNPDDATELGIKDGDHIRLYNDRGDVTMMAVISAGYPRNMIGVPRGHIAKEFIDGHFSNISSDVFNQCCANQAYSDQAVAIEKL